MTTKRLIGAAITIAGVLALAGCTGDGEQQDVDAFTTWNAEAHSQLSAPDGAGGASGGGSGRIRLDSVPEGEYAIWAACGGAESVSIVVSSGGEILAEIDTACGTTEVVPVTTTAPDVTLEAANDPETGYWAAYLNPPGWSPSAG
jgi:hypothetical protein